MKGAKLKKDLLQRVEKSPRKHNIPIKRQLLHHQYSAVDYQGKAMQIPLGKNTAMPILWQENIT